MTGDRAAALGPSGITSPGRRDDLPEGPLGAVGGGSLFFIWTSGLGSIAGGRLILEACRWDSTAFAAIRFETTPSRSSSTLILRVPMRCSFLHSKYARRAALDADADPFPRAEVLSLYLMEQIPRNRPVMGSVRFLISATSPKLEKSALIGAIGVKGSNPVTTT